MFIFYDLYFDSSDDIDDDEHIGALILFSQDIPNISLFSLDLATRDGIPFARWIFDEYILLFGPYLNARN